MGPGVADAGHCGFAQVQIVSGIRVFIRKVVHMQVVSPIVRHLCPAFVIASAALSTIGCGGGDIPKLPVYKTTGKLTLDGKPFGPAAVLLVPTKTGDEKKDKLLRSVAGEADAQGNITFTSYAKGDGAPAGSYNVAVMPSLMAPAKDPIPNPYLKPESSGIQVKIEGKDGNEVKVDMDSKKSSAMNAATAATSAPPLKQYPAINPEALPKTSP